MKKLEISQMEYLQGGYEPSYDLCVLMVLSTINPFQLHIMPDTSACNKFL